MTTDIDTAVARVRAEVPAAYWQTTSDCHGPAPAYTSPDGAIRQLRPSSGPVFAARTPAGEVIIKPGRGTAFAVREHTGLQVLARHVPVPATALHYQGENTTLIAEHLDAVPLRDLAVTDPAAFEHVLGDLCARLVHLATATAAARPYREQDADHSLQTPRCCPDGWRTWPAGCVPGGTIPCTSTGSPPSSPARDWSTSPAAPWPPAPTSPTTPGTSTSATSWSIAPTRAGGG